MRTAVLTFFGVGRSPFAPGTAGSAAAALLGMIIHVLGGPVLLTVSAAAAAVSGFVAVGKGKETNDSPEIVIDEVAGQLVALLPVSFFLARFPETGLPVSGAFWLLAFGSFRLFDIWKPSLVGKVDRRHDSWSIMLDDLLAGLLAALVVTLAAAGYVALAH